MLIRAIAIISTILYIVNTVGSLSTEYPEIHDEEACEEGKIYRHRCNTCKCKKHTLICTKMACFDFTFPDALRQQPEKRKAAKRSKSEIENELDVSENEYLNLPKLAHHAADCTPEKKYRVDCNVCICNQQGNLECDNEMCVDEKSTLVHEVTRNSEENVTNVTVKQTKACNVQRRSVSTTNKLFKSRSKKNIF